VRRLEVDAFVAVGVTGGAFHMALVGWPVGHSLSPLLWEGVGKRRGIAIEYARYPVEPEDAAAWDALWASDLHGFNVTAPYKERAAARCDLLSPAAAEIRSVNTVIRDSGGWTGHSTDGYGFVRAMLAAGEPLRGRSLAVLGTGGAGRSVARAAAEAGAAVTMVSRSPDRVPPGCGAFPRIGWEALAEQGPFEVVVNATPVGRGRAAGEPPSSWVRACAGALAFDLNYTPPVTSFLRAARAAGARTLNGFSTLIYQACMGAALLLDGDPAAAESYEEDFRAVAREVAPQVGR
jgi:shikimate dehydrogenase